MGELMGGLIHLWIDEWVDWCVGRSVDKWINGSVDWSGAISMAGLIGERMNEWVGCLGAYIHCLDQWMMDQCELRGWTDGSINKWLGDWWGGR